MKERKGPFGMMVGGIVDSVVQTARRRAQDREPRALVYDASGRPRLVRADAPGREELIAAAALLIELAGPRPPEVVEDDEGDAGLAADAEADPEVAADAEAAAEAEVQADAADAGADDDPGEPRV